MMSPYAAKPCYRRTLSSIPRMMSVPCKTSRSAAGRSSTPGTVASHTRTPPFWTMCAFYFKNRAWSAMAGMVEAVNQGMLTDDVIR